MTEQNYTQDQIVEKIKKLLALAGNNDSMEQAQAALAKAQELQAKYNISVETLETESEKEDKVTESFVESPETVSFDMKFAYLAKALASHFRVMVYLNRQTGKSVLAVIGMKTDVDIFTQTLHFAYNAMRRLGTMYVKQMDKSLSRSEKTRRKNDYILGFIRGCHDALVRNEQEKSLMVVTPDAVVKRFNSLSLRKSGSQMSTSGDMAAYSAGYSDGKSSIGNKRALAM